MTKRAVIVLMALMTLSLLSCSTQRTVIYNGLQATKGQTFSIQASDGTTIVSYELPRTMNGMSVLYSSPSLQAGSYTIYVADTQLTTFTATNTVTTLGNNTGGGGPGGNAPGGGGRP